MSTHIKTLGLSILGYLPAVRKFLWEWKIDIFLVLASSICFGLYFDRSINLEQMSGIGGPIALITQGMAERKASGTNLFVDVGPNSNLYNLDAIWVGKDGDATIQLDSNTSIRLAEKTLMILKKPFKHVPGHSALEEGIKVVKGKVQTAEGKTVVPAVETLAPVIPDSAPTDAKHVPIELYPKDNSTIYMRPEKDIPLTFAWPTALSGYIVIQDKATGRKIYAELVNQRSYSAKLEQSGSYFWQMIDPDRRPILGPYTFVVKHLTDDAAKQLIKSGTESNTEVYW